MRKYISLISELRMHEIFTPTVINKWTLHQTRIQNAVITETNKVQTGELKHGGDIKQFSMMYQWKTKSKSNKDLHIPNSCISDN